MWDDAAAYEAYVGGWSRLIAPRFLEWLDVPRGRRWLDIACGTGVVTESILALAHPAAIVSIDASAAYLAKAATACRGLRVRFIRADATALPCSDRCADAAVSGLALNFMAFDRALAEQRRVVRAGGIVGAYVWDYSGEYEFARRFWDAAMKIDERAASYDPGRKAAICREDALARAITAAGFGGVRTSAFDAWGAFPSREAYWACFDGRQGSTAAYLSLLTGPERTAVRDSLFASLAAEGSIRLKVRALAVKGRAPADAA